MLLPARLPPPPSTPRHSRRHPLRHYNYTALPECVPPHPTTNNTNNPGQRDSLEPCSSNSNSLTTPLLTASHSSNIVSTPPTRPLPPCDLPLVFPPHSPANSLSGVASSSQLCGVITPPRAPQPRTNPYFAPSSSSTSPLSPVREPFGPFASPKPFTSSVASSISDGLLQSSYVNLAASSDTETVTVLPGGSPDEESSMAVVVEKGWQLPAVSLLPLARSKTQPLIQLRPHQQQAATENSSSHTSAGHSQEPTSAAYGFNTVIHPSYPLPPVLSSFSPTNPFLDSPNDIPPPQLSSFAPAVRPAAVANSRSAAVVNTNPFRVPLSQIPPLAPGDHSRELGQLFFARLRLQASRSSSARSRTPPCVIAATNISDPLAAPPPQPAANTLPPIRKTSQVNTGFVLFKSQVSVFVCVFFLVLKASYWDVSCTGIKHY